MDLFGTVALVTGSGRGLGLAFARSRLGRAAIVINDVDTVVAAGAVEASAAADGFMGQCIGLGGDRLALWTHPQEKRVALRGGGWTAETIAKAWRTEIGAEPETFGVEPLS